jgi:diadenosine tetraphosphatase ApaH/serine/threonine PP2A family protein phosphatase
MRYLVLADIHANGHALEAVLADAQVRGFDQILLLGDLIGYGAQPNEVLDRLASVPVAAAIRGNHDKVAVGLDDADAFNPAAKQGAEWTQHALTPAHAELVRALPRGPLIVTEWIEICHGSPYDEDAYVLDALDALNALRAARRPLCLFGHSHAPTAFLFADNELHCRETPEDFVLQVMPEWTCLVNVGSVGQPRDGDPRAAYGIADDDRKDVSFFRVPYDVAAAQQAIRDAGLPDALAKRLALGR